MLQPDKARLAFRLGIALAAVTPLLIMWTTIVQDGSGEGAVMLIMAAAVGSYAARFQSDGMARAMVGVAVMQAALGALAATAPITATYPDGPLRALLFHGGFSLLWLGSAALFRTSGRTASGPGASQVAASRRPG